MNQAILEGIVALIFITVATARGVEILYPPIIDAINEWRYGSKNPDKLKNEEKRKNSEPRAGDYVRTPDGEWAEVVNDDHAPLSSDDMDMVRRLSKPKRTPEPAPKQPERVPYIEEPIKFTIKPSGDHWLAEHTLGTKATPRDVEYSLQRRVPPRRLDIFRKPFSVYQNYVKAMREYFGIGLMTDNEWLRRSAQVAVDPEAAYRETLANVEKQYKAEQRSALDKWTYRSVAFDPDSYGVSYERLAQMRELLPKRRRGLFWYTTRLAVDQFCTANKIPRRFDQHWDRWINDTHMEYEENGIEKTKLETEMSDAVIDQWITSSPMRGASDWPVNIFGSPIRYVPGHVLPYTVTDRDQAYPFLFLLADFENSQATAITHTGQLYRFEILSEMLESIPYDLDLDGNPEYDGHVYSYPIRIDRAQEAADRLSDAIGENDINIVDLTTRIDRLGVSTSGVQYDLTPEEQERLDNS